MALEIKTNQNLQDESFYCDENVCSAKLRETEDDIKQLVSYHNGECEVKKLSDADSESLKELLARRKWILDRMLPDSPTTRERLSAINEKFISMNDKLHQRMSAMQQKLSLIFDDPEFDDDYEIEGIISFVCDDDNSILFLDDDWYYGSDFYAMMRIINKWHYYKDRACKHIIWTLSEEDELARINWNEWPLSHEDIDYCYAMYQLNRYSLYSISDILRMNDFWVEVKLVEQHFANQDGKSYKSERMIKILEENKRLKDGKR